LLTADFFILPSAGANVLAASSAYPRKPRHFENLDTGTLWTSMARQFYIEAMQGALPALPRHDRSQQGE
jgi:hypothetical protein